MSPAGGGRVAQRICGATTGFFVLARCDARARQGCVRCSRSLCPRHVMALPGDPSPVCPECYAAARGYVGDPTDDDWAIGFRRSFYWEVSTTTGDESWWSGFDEVDRESFDSGMVDTDGDGVPDAWDADADGDGFDDDGGGELGDDGGYDS